MSDKNLRSALKRKAVEDPTTSPQRKNKPRLSTEDTINQTRSPRAQRLPSTLRRDKSFSIPIDEGENNLSDKEIFDPMNPTKFIPATFLPEYKQVHTNASHSQHKSDSNNYLRVHLQTAKMPPFLTCHHPQTTITQHYLCRINTPTCRLHPLTQPPFQLRTLSILFVNTRLQSISSPTPSPLLLLSLDGLFKK